MVQVVFERIVCTDDHAVAPHACMLARIVVEIRAADIAVEVYRDVFMLTERTVSPLHLCLYFKRF